MGEARLKKPRCIISVDSSLCSGCRICEVVCSLLKTGAVAPELSRIRVTARFLEIELTPNPCLQCEEAVCMEACPVEAIFIDATTSAKIVDEELCIGCRACVEACRQSHGLPRIGFDEGRQVAFKCDLCGGDPQCVRFCPMGALSYIVTYDRTSSKSDEE